MEHPSSIKEVCLTGHDLTLEQFIAVARYGAKVSVSEEAMSAMTASRALAEEISKEKRVVYGITTGFGDFANVAVPEEMSNQLSTNLVISHSVGTGTPYSIEQVRGMMLLRANALAVGISGVRPTLVTMLCDMLNKGVTPVIPQKGSLGASGDLAPLSHMGLVMLGRGRAYYQGNEYDGAKAMELANIPVLMTLVSKEGLGITNGTCTMTSVGALYLYDTMRAAELADIVSSITFTALGGQLDAFQERMHTVRHQKGQVKVARNMRLLTRSGEIVERCQGARVQDAYALRCIPQIHGAIRDAIEYVKEKVELELNAVTDNPLMFTEDGAVISGGNFHGEPMALAFDFLGIACSEIASSSERRTERMVNAALSNGLTPFLTINGGVNSGFMIVQYSAASMASENKVFAHPACVDSIPSSANQEDFVSMGTTAARKVGLILENTRSVLAYELYTACQAVDIRRRVGPWGEGLSPAVDAVYSKVRESVPFVGEDRELRIDIEKLEKLVRTEELQERVKEIIPDFA